MTLQERLQGEWLCCIEDQDLEQAWSIDIRGGQCNFERTMGTLVFAGDEATLDLGNGDRLVINRRSLMGALEGDASENELPVVIEGDRGTLHSGWMFRPGLVTAKSAVRAAGPALDQGGGSRDEQEAKQAREQSTEG